MIDVKPHMAIITQEAKRYRAKLPRSHPVEVADLVAGGALHVLESLRLGCNAGPALVRVRARQGMLAEIRRWDHGTKGHPVSRRDLVDFDAWSSVESSVDLRRCVQPPPIELMIDLLREVLKLRLWNALAWVNHYLAENDHEVAAQAFNVEKDQMRTAAERARRELAAALEVYEPRTALGKWERVEALLRQGRSVNEVARTVKTEWAKVARIQDRLDPAARARRARQAMAMRHERRDIPTIEIVTLRKSGKTQREIAEAFGVGQKLINGRLKKLGMTGTRERPLRVCKTQWDARRSS